MIVGKIRLDVVDKKCSSAARFGGLQPTACSPDVPLRVLASR